MWREECRECKCSGRIDCREFRIWVDILCLSMDEFEDKKE